MVNLHPRSFRWAIAGGAIVLLLVVIFIRWLDLPPAAPPVIPGVPTTTKHWDPATQASKTLLQGQSMGCVWSVRFAARLDPREAAELQSAVASLMDELDSQLSNYRPQSALSRFNAYRETDWFAVPEALAEVVEQAQCISRLSGGAFDITVAPLVDLWGFGAGSPLALPAIPTQAQIAAARAHVGHAKLHVRRDPPSIRKDDPELRIDVGGIGKGFAADGIDRLLQTRGRRAYLIAVGGELRARGHGVTGDGWNVGIDAPIPDTHRIVATVMLKDASLSTSGDYRNFHQIAGQRYSHEIDSQTGWPIESREPVATRSSQSQPVGTLASVAVLHESGAIADAWATALIVLGPQRGPAMARQQNLAAVFVFRDDSNHLTLRPTTAFEFHLPKGP